jgi:HlyD family secretion protein
MSKILRQSVIALTVVVVVSVVTGYSLWRWRPDDELPKGIVSANGRIEAQEYDIATKRGGRISKVLADEGDPVRKGQLLVEMDLSEFNARLDQAKAQRARAKKAITAARAGITRRESELNLAKQEHGRIVELFERGIVPANQRDRAENELATAEAALTAARARHVETEAAHRAAQARVKRIEVEIENARLEAPKDGKILYRLAEPGEVLPPGGRVLTLVDLDDVYMIVFLPATEAGKLAIGAQARIVPTALKKQPVPGRVSFVSEEAQFTPKFVETQEERQTLMFRVEVDATENPRGVLKPGMPGVAYMKVDPAVEWPEHLR